MVSVEKDMTEGQKALLKWLKGQKAGHLGSLYVAAVSMIQDKSFPGRITFIAHAVREIRNRLPDILSGTAGSGRLDVNSRVQHLVQGWDQYRVTQTAETYLSRKSMTTDGPGTVAIPSPVFQIVESIVVDFRNIHNKKEEAARRLFDALVPRVEKDSGLIEPVIRQWMKVTDWFLHYAHESVDGQEAPQEEDLRRTFSLFEETLMAIQKDFFDNLGELDDIVDQANRRTT